MLRKINGLPPLNKEGLSEYEYFCTLVNDVGEKQITSRDDFVDKYYLIDNVIPVTMVTVREEAPGIVEVRYATVPRYQHRGYASKAL